MYFSLLVERKVPKETPLKEGTHGTFLENPSPYHARLFAKGETADVLLGRSLTKGRGVGDMADHLGQLSDMQP